MTERPILFSGTMVQAILAGRKSVTRRLVTAATSEVDGRGWPQHNWTSLALATARRRGNGDTLLAECQTGCVHKVRARIEAGDRLWVRETWGYEDDTRVRDRGAVVYRANPCRRDAPGVRCEHGPSRWRPSIHMPRWASRLDLDVVSVRPEQLQEITDTDALAEGIAPIWIHRSWKVLCTDGRAYDTWAEPDASEPDVVAFVENAPLDFNSPRSLFRMVWDEINRKRAPWDSNPWVWRIEFQRTQP